MGEYAPAPVSKKAKYSPAATAGFPITCKAAVVGAPGEKFKIEEITVAPPRKYQVCIKILYASVCQSDITFAKFKEMAPLFPAIFGHEAAGIVESVGEGVTNVQVGDHVLPFMQGQCEDQCGACKNDWSNVCTSRPALILGPTLMGDDEPHFTNKDGKILSRFWTVSTFSEYTVVYKDNVVKINPQAPLEKACVLTCGVGTGLGAAWKVSKVRPGSTVAIFGLGTVGLAVAEACRVAGASRIIGVDINPSKAEQGKVFGMTDFVNPKDHKKDIPEVIREISAMGVDYSFECTGNVKVLADAVETTHKEWGVTVVIGVPSGLHETAAISPFSLLYGRTMVGTTVGGLRIRDLPELVEQSMRKEFQLDPFVTHHFPFSKINEAVDLFKSGDCLRCVLHMGS